MGTKLHPGDFDCYANARDDEPMFVLLARDPVAPQLIRSWCYLRKLWIKTGLKPETDYDMINEAARCADAMEKWRKENWTKPKKPVDDPPVF